MDTTGLSEKAAALLASPDAFVAEADAAGIDVSDRNVYWNPMRNSGCLVGCLAAMLDDSFAMNYDRSFHSVLNDHGLNRDTTMDLEIGFEDLFYKAVRFPDAYAFGRAVRLIVLARATQEVR